MHRNDRDVGTCGQFGQCIMIGAVQAIDPLLALSVRYGPVAGNNRPVVKLHDQGRIVLSPVRVNHQPRKV